MAILVKFRTFDIDSSIALKAKDINLKKIRKASNLSQLQPKEYAMGANFLPNKTLAALNIIVSDFKRVRTIVNIVLPIIMISYYIYSVVTLVGQGGYLLYINATMLALLSLSYVSDLILEKLHREKKALRKNVARTFSYLQHFVKIVSATFILYEILSYEVTALKTVFSLISVACVVIQIIIDILTVIIEHYLKLVTEAIKMDFEELKNSTTGKVVGKTIDIISDFKSNAVELIDIPLAAIADKKNGTPLTPVAQPILTKAESKRQEKLTQKAQEISEQKTLNKAEKDAKKKIAKEQRLNEAKGNLKGHVADIFKKKPQG